MFGLVCRPPHCGGSHRKNTRVALQSKQKVNCVANTKVNKKKYDETQNRGSHAFRRIFHFQFRAVSRSSDLGRWFKDL